jgi:hypothetical protein
MVPFDSFKKPKNKDAVSPDESLTEWLKVFSEDIQEGGLSLNESPSRHGDFRLVAATSIPTFFATGLAR